MAFHSLAEYRQQAQFLQVDKYRLAYWIEGKGPTVLLIHGFPSASWDWHHLLDSLCNDFQVIAIDMLGFGLSDKPYPHDYQLLEQADIIGNCMKQLQVQQVHILAHDYGNSVAQELLARQQSYQLDFAIDSIAFLNGGLFSEAHRPLLTQRLLKGPLGGVISRLLSKASLARGFGKIFGAKTPPSEREIDIIWSLLRHNQGQRVLPAILQYLDQRKLHRDRWVEAMQQSTVPMRFINGVEDPISGEHMVARYRQLIAAADIVCLPCGHYPQLELPQRVINHYRDLLANGR